MRRNRAGVDVQPLGLYYHVAVKRPRDAVRGQFGPADRPTGADDVDRLNWPLRLLLLLLCALAVAIIVLAFGARASELDTGSAHIDWWRGRAHFSHL